MVIFLIARVKFYIIFQAQMKKKSAYENALDYIYSFIDYSLSRNLRYSPEKFNLDRMSRFLELIGNPQNTLKAIHVAGTKGKGSICAILTSILESQGYKTGFYSSPHMIDFAERIRIGDQFISQNEIVDYVEILRPYIEKIDRISTFEITTAIALKYFMDQSVDFGVIEVGMGGRFDATNLVKPIISVISNISHDHTRILGKTLVKISFEKAGIIKEGVPVVVSNQKKAALLTLEEVARKKNARLINASQIYKYRIIAKDFAGQQIEIMNIPNKEKSTFFLRLLGKHQVQNAVTALAVVSELRKQGFHISEKAVNDGLSSVKWPGRFEVVREHPIVVVDSAHNPESFRRLKEAIRDYLENKKITLILGVSEDKDIRSMLTIIKPAITKIIITHSNHPRALDEQIIKKISDELGIRNEIIENIEEAIYKSYSRVDHDTAIVAAGSIFIAGAVREYFEDRENLIMN